MRSIPEHHLDWHRSSYSGGTGGNCLEAALGDTTLVPVRDSENPLGPKLLFRAEAWSAFVGSLTHPE